MTPLPARMRIAQPVGEELLREVQAIFTPVKNTGHIEGLLGKTHRAFHPSIRSPTHHAHFEEVPEVFPSWLKPESGVIKAVVHI